VSEFYKRVPTELRANLEYRKDLLQKCRTDLKTRHTVSEVCRQDALFWMNAFCFAYEPRPRRGLPKKIPFIAWDHQVPAILAIREALGYKDIGVEKSRGEGASWIGILLALHDWLYADMTTIGFVSKDQDAADTPDDPDSLMGKIDWELKQLPVWMAGEANVDFKRNRSDHLLKNLRNGSIITAFAATGNVASGGRRTWFLMDELAKFPRGPDAEAMASTQHVTESRFVVSTPLGAEGAYYEWMHQPSNMVKVVLDWKQNPTRNRGLYRLNNGIPVAIDEKNPLPAEYSPPTPQILKMFDDLRARGFILEDKDRSPWYDTQCYRGQATPSNIAQELDRDYGGSVVKVFPARFIQQVEKTVAPPIHEGFVNFDKETLENWRFDATPHGPMKLWCAIDNMDRPPLSSYVLGCDISSGAGGTFTSNSVVVGIDTLSNEQVFEFASRVIQPQDFADICVALAKWFHGAYLIWEVNGPGSSFTRRVLHQCYGNVYYRTSTEQWGRKKQKKIGFNTTPTTKNLLFGDLTQSVQERTFTIRSREILKEIPNYVYKNGLIHHALIGAGTDDAIGVSHGDRVIAAGVALHGMLDRPSPQKQSEQSLEKCPEGTFGHRYRMHLESLKQKEADWID
jgi:hypothetical protein